MWNTCNYSNKGFFSLPLVSQKAAPQERAVGVSAGVSSLKQEAPPR